MSDPEPEEARVTADAADARARMNALIDQLEAAARGFRREVGILFGSELGGPAPPTETKGGAGRDG